MTQDTAVDRSIGPASIAIEANGVAFSALAWGEADAPLALLVHGYPDTAWTWRHLGPYLARAGWRAVAPFTRGYGPTALAPDDDYSLASQTADLIALHGALGGDGRAVLVGHDWGAVAAYGVTVNAPGLFASVATIAVPPPIMLVKPFVTPRHFGLAARQLRMSWYMLFNQLPGISERGLDRVIPKLWRDWSPGYDAREDLDHVFESLDGPGRRRAALRYYRNSLSPRNLAKTFTVKAAGPVLYLHGEADGCQLAEIGSLGALPAGSRAERLDGVGHFMQLEQPDRVNALITAWIGSPTP